MFCTKCGANLADNAKFCNKCGAPQNQTVIPKKVVEQKQQNIENKKPNKKIQGSIVNSDGGKEYSNMRLIGLSFVTVLVVTILGILYYLFAPAGPSNDDIKKTIQPIITQSNISRKEKFEIKNIKVDQKQLNENKTWVDLVCKVELESEDVKKEQYFQLSFNKFDDNWKVDKCLPYNSNSWKSEPLKGVAENTVKQSFVGQKVKIGNTDLVIAESKIDEIKIAEHKADLAKGLDEIKVSFKYKDKIASKTFDAMANYEFANDQWKLSNIRIDEKDNKIQYNAGYEFKKNLDDIKQDLYKSPLYWKIGDHTQKVSVDDKSIKDAKLSDRYFNWNDGTVSQNCEFELDKNIAKINVKANMVYEYASSGWKLKNISYDKKLADVSLKGTWKGKFEYGGRKPNVVINIREQDANGMLSGTLQYGPSPSNPDLVPGSYTFVGGVEKENLKVKFRFNDWINQPRGWSNQLHPDLEGFITFDNGTIENTNNYNMLNISKSSN